MPVVKRTTQADADLSEIYLYHARRSLKAADRVLDGIEHTCQRLAQFPRLGRPRSDLGPGLHSYSTPDGYIVYYLIIRGGIEVQRVRHGSRQVDPTMFDV